MAGNEKYSDEDIELALKKARGMPTKAAEILGADYTGIWRRIKANPELKEVQDSFRSRKFNHYDDLAERAVLLGLMRVPEINEDGNIIEGTFRDEIVDVRTRLDLLKNQMNLNKGSEGIKDQIDHTSGGKPILPSITMLSASDLSDEQINNLLGGSNGNHAHSGEVPEGV